MKEIVTREDAWEACLALWKRLSEMPDDYIRSNTSDFKNEILDSLGYEDCNLGCPFCEYFHNGNCDDCPLGKEFDGCLTEPCPYCKWSDYADEGTHDQESAKKFYECLCELHEKELRSEDDG